jgi:DNA-binding HxlR family transcriptional regulator
VELNFLTDEIKQQNPLRLQLLLKKSEVARLIAVAPQYLSELLRQLENEGILRREKGWLIVLDRERLWHEAEF